MQAGFIGLGKMGAPIARRLIAAGHQLIVFNRTRSRARALAGPGATVAASVAEPCATGTVLTMLADDQALEAYAFAPRGILDSLPAGGVHLSLSTVSVGLAKRLAAEHRTRNQWLISSPVFGRPDAAEAGRLVVVAAGADEAIARCRPLLEAIGQQLFVLGPEPALANTLKLAGNFLIASVLEALAEAFALLRKSGIDPARLLEIVNGSLFRSPVYENYGRLMLEQRFEPAGFTLRLGLKDARLVLAAAEEAAVPMPVASLVYDQLLSGLARGWGEKDWCALVKLASDRAGLDSSRARGMATAAESGPAPAT